MQIGIQTRAHQFDEVVPVETLLRRRVDPLQRLAEPLAAFREHDISPPTLLSLAKREEEIFRPGESEPLRLSRHAFALQRSQ